MKDDASPGNHQVLAIQPFSLLVKPAGGGCNLDCSYCFYKKDHAAGFMSFDTAARMLDEYCALPFEEKAVALQGGEPLLALHTGVFDLMCAPQVDEVSLSVGGGKVFRMKANNLSAKNKYVKSATLNGKPLDGFVIRHADIMAGGELVFEMGE